MLFYNCRCSGVWRCLFLFPHVGWHRHGTPDQVEQGAIGFPLGILGIILAGCAYRFGYGWPPISGSSR